MLQVSVSVSLCLQLMMDETKPVFVAPKKTRSGGDADLRMAPRGGEQGQLLLVLLLAQPLLPAHRVRFEKRLEKCANFHLMATRQ